MLQMWAIESFCCADEDDAANNAPPVIRNKKPIRWVLGLIIGQAAIVGLAAYAVWITPSSDMLTILFWIGAVPFGVFGWLWMGADAIPGKRKRSRGAVHSWTIVGLAFIIGGFIGYIPLISPIAYGLFPAFLLSMAARVGWNYWYNGRLRFCNRCMTYRWFFRFQGEWYCNKLGHKWYEINSQ